MLLSLTMNSLIKVMLDRSLDFRRQLAGLPVRVLSFSLDSASLSAVDQPIDDLTDEIDDQNWEIHIWVGYYAGGNGEWSWSTRL